jgi:triosephosphate isomerase
MRPTPILVGNWKMNTDAESAVALAEACVALADAAGDAVEVGVAPPALWLRSVVEVARGSRLQVWGQQVGHLAVGALTGETAASMLAEAGACGTLVGHSERRLYYGESDARSGDCVVQALDAGLRVILCVGERLEDRDEDRTWRVVEGQLAGGLGRVSEPSRLVVAYEPVWAIGTGRTATPGQAQAVHAQIRGWLTARWGAAGSAVPIQYGGSMTGATAGGLLAEADIDGGLVGGASLQGALFAPLVDAAVARAARG